MCTIAVTDGIKGLVPCRASGSLKLLYMTHLAWVIISIMFSSIFKGFGTQPQKAAYQGCFQENVTPCKYISL